MSLQERKNLWISGEHLQSLLIGNGQFYFNPDEGQDEFTTKLAKIHFSCFKCKKIPIGLRECKDCGEIVCIPCIKQGTGCPACNSTNEFVELKNKQKKMISDLKETHTCSPFDQSKVLKLNIFDLGNHFMSLNCQK